MQGYFLKCLLRADVLLYTLFTVIHSQGTNCFSSVLLTEKKNPPFDSARAISQLLANRTNCPAFLSFSPSCQSSRSLKSFSLTKVIFRILSVMQEPLSELSFQFPSTVSDSHLLQEGKAGHFHCWQRSSEKKFPENSQFSLCTFFSLQLWLHFYFQLVVLTQFYVFLMPNCS